MAKPIGILYEHPEWFRPLFAELEQRGLPYELIQADSHSYDPAESSAPYSLVVNRVSPSSYLRDHTAAIFYARQYLAHLERIGVPMVNGPAAYALETSKALQLDLLARLGLPHPRSRVVNSLAQLAPAASALEFPIIVKPNIGGSGALMRRFDSLDELEAAGAGGELDGVFGLDQTAIVQEYHPTLDGSITRVEVLDGQLLYGISIYNQSAESFNLCPADICQIDTVEAPAPQDVAVRLLTPLAPAPAKKPLRIEAAEPPAWIVDSVRQVFASSGIDVGGVEYLVSARDGQTYLYDVNALSNFVTDAQNLVGFDPFVRFVDYIARRAGLELAASVA